MSAPINVLFLCTGNSARSIMAEAVLNHKGHPHFVAYSAGSRASGRVRPEALLELSDAGIPIAGLRSKSWEEFSLPNAPEMQLVVTVCDNAASESCPLWHGNPVKMHWGLPDPAAVAGSEDEVRAAFHHTFQALVQKVEALMATSRPLSTSSGECV